MSASGHSHLPASSGSTDGPNYWSPSWLLLYPVANPSPWNKGKLVGQKAPFKLREIWAIRVRLQLNQKVRDLALFNLAIDSKLRACDLVGLHVADVAHGDKIG